MQRWQLTTGLAAFAVLAAIVVPSIPGLRGSIEAPPRPETPEPPEQPVTAEVQGDGLLKLTAELDQESLLQGNGDERFVVIDVSAPQLEGDVRRPVNVAVVMDVSGSMAGRGKMDHARMAASELVELLQPGDSFSLVTFSDKANVLVEASPTVDHQSAQRAIRLIQPGGGTNLYDGLAQGIEQLKQTDLNGVKRVVILSDGMANIGITDNTELARAAGSAVGAGVTVSALGLGLDYNEDLLAAMSDAGGGAYHFVDRPGQLAEMFTTELNQMTAVAGREAAVDVTLASGVTLLEVYGYEASRDRDGFQVFLGDVHGGETRKIVARVRVDTAEVGSVDVADVDLRYTDPEGGDSARATADVSANVTKDTRLAQQSINPMATKKVARARAAKALDEGARAWEKGDRSLNTQKLEESVAILRAIGDSGLAAEADHLSAQQAAFEAAAPASDDGIYQVKKAKEAARAYSR